MSEGIDLKIENVRRLATAEVAIRPRSRTVIVGRNNTGKTTLLDMVARALWSLPGHFDDQHRQFHQTWYRRTAEVFHRPRITVTLDPALMSSELGAKMSGRLMFELLGSHHEGQITRASNQSTKLVAIRCEIETPESRTVLFEPTTPPGIELWSESTLKVHPMVLDERQWATPVDPSKGLSNGHSPVQVYQSVTPLARAAANLARKVIYLPASRSPNFGAARALGTFSQSNYLDVTSLLIDLHTSSVPRFLGISSALSLLFPDVKELTFGAHPEGKVLEVEFVSGRREHVGNLGYGFQNAVHILTMCSLCPEGAVLLVDEPEKGLNQSTQRDLGMVLEAIRPDIALVVATQSEPLCRGFSADSSVILAEADGDKSRISRVEIAGEREHLARFARAMGLDPIYLSDGGRIVYVEGISDEAILDKWIKLHLPACDGAYQVVSLGGCGKLGEEFIKPILRVYCDRVFVLLDSDRNSEQERMSVDIQRLATWLGENSVPHYVLRKRELENYVGADAIAKVADVHPADLRSASGGDDWFDIKAAFARRRGYPYEERRLTISAFDSLSPADQRNLFSGETGAILSGLRLLLNLDGGVAGAS
jgi:ABC-type branched-subunit amino acid transport system ATPase component